MFEPHRLYWRIDVGHQWALPHGFSHYMYISMGAIDPWGKDSLDPRDLIGRIYIVLYTCVSCEPHGFKIIFLRFSH